MFKYVIADFFSNSCSDDVVTRCDSIMYNISEGDSDQFDSAVFEAYCR